MKTLSSIIILFLSAIVSVNAQTVRGNGDIITTNRSVGDFEKIAVSGSFKVTLKKGNEGDLTLKGESNILDYVETEVSDNTLKIKYKRGVRIRSSKSIYVTINFEDVQGIAISGSSKVTSEDEISAKKLGLSLSGSGGIDLKVNARSIGVAISGSGNMHLKGSTEELSCAISGSGNVNAYNLKAKKVEAAVSGSGNIKIHATDEIIAKSSGSGSVHYKGDPPIVKAKSSGSGSVKKKD